MFFSVIVPVYNVEKYIRPCIESVLNQSFGDFELILVDDGSPDRCPEICDEYAEKDSRIRVFHKENGGLASARQAGIRLAEGEYVFNLDSDDAIENDTLDYAHEIICDTNCDIVSFSYKWIENGKTAAVTTDGIEEGFYDRAKIEKEIFPRLLMNENMEHVSYYLAGKAMRRELVRKHQLNVNPKISLGEDLCCVFPCYLDAKSVYISKKEAYLYSKRNDSISKNFNTGQIQRIEDVINEIKALKLKPCDFENQLSRYSCFMCFAILASAAEGNHFKHIKELKTNILKSIHMEKIKAAQFENITLKSKIAIFLMKKECFHAAFYFLNLCKNIKLILKKG